MALAEGRCSRELIPCRVPDLAAWNLWAAHCLVRDGMVKEFSLTWRLPDKAVGSYIPAKYLARGAGNLGSLREGTAPLVKACVIAMQGSLISTGPTNVPNLYSAHEHY